MFCKIRTILDRTCNLVVHHQYIPTEYYVFEKNNIVYIPIPKVACTSIKIALMGDALNQSDKHNNYNDIHKLTAKFRRHSLTRHQKDYFVFAFVRNPFDRLVSCYKDKVKREVQHNNRHYFATNYNNILIKNAFGGRFHFEMSFEEFVQLVAKIPDFLSDGHFKSQYAMLYDQNRRVPNFVGKYENMQNNWASISRRYKLPPLAELNSTTKEDWKSYYKNKIIVEAVAERYKQDIELFGYTEEYKTLMEQL